MPVDIQKLQDKIAGKLAQSDQSKKKDDASKEQKQASFLHLVFKYADSKDKCTFAVATVSALAFGIALPITCLFWGKMMDSVGGAMGRDTFEALT